MAAASTSDSQPRTDRPRTERQGLAVGQELDDFVMNEALPGSGVDPDAFWAGFAGLIADFAPRNRELLEKRDEIQAAIDACPLRSQRSPPRARQSGPPRRREPTRAVAHVRERLRRLVRVDLQPRRALNS